MSTKLGHFEILSELSKSATCVVYKANDSQSGQTVALKAIQLSAFGERAAELQQCLLEEAEAVKELHHSNLTPVQSAAEIDGQFCAAMEYIQGNSIATMLARKEGFSIWDLLDIGRQVCGGLDQASSQKIFHHSLEPAKIMCGWDSTVRILGYGVSGVGKFTAQMPGIPSILHYMSPEQIRGESIDARSNLFSLGAMFYEMVTDRKAFDREDAESLRQSILESTPVPPMHVNAKLHPVLSDLIMKALAKNPAERYQSGRELLDDLEKCKESKSKAAPAAAKTAAASSVAAPSVAVPNTVKAAAQTKFANASAPSRPAETQPQAVQPVPSQPAEKKFAAPSPAPTSGKAAAAAAGWDGGRAVSSTPVKASHSAPAQPTESMSASVLDEPAVDAPEAETPRIAVDPMMAGGGPSRSGGVSFSEMTELPPLKEVYVPPPPPPPSLTFEQKQPHAPTLFTGVDEEEKPKVQPREVAQKAMKEIKNVPPQLMVYSIAGAAIVILIIAVVLVMHVNSLNSDGDTPRPAATEATPQPAAAQPTPAQPAPAAAPTQAQTEPAQPPAPVAEAEPAPTRVAAAAAGKGKNGRKRTAQASPAAVPGQMAIDSTPQGAQVQIDGRTDPSWVTPFTLPGLEAGSHTITVSKAGYSTDTRAVEVVSGGKAFVTSHLALLMATLAVSSTPAGANVYIDGKDTGKLTPAQVSVDKGQHVVLVRKSGYLDETTNTQFVLGQTVSFSPALRALGNVDDIKTVGKMNKLFGGKDAQGMGTVFIKTQPKGAQVAVNQHMLDKDTPVNFVLDPGNYVVDITMSGYATIHKVVAVDKGGKVVIDEILQHQ